MLQTSNVSELKEFCKDELAKIPPQRCERLISSHCVCLIAVLAITFSYRVWISLNKLNHLKYYFVFTLLLLLK